MVQVTLAIAKHENDTNDKVINFEEIQSKLTHLFHTKKMLTAALGTITIKTVVYDCDC